MATTTRTRKTSKTTKPEYTEMQKAAFDFTEAIFKLRGLEATIGKNKTEMVAMLDEIKKDVVSDSTSEVLFGNYNPIAKRLEQNWWLSDLFSAIEKDYPEWSTSYDPEDLAKGYDYEILQRDVNFAKVVAEIVNYFHKEMTRKMVNNNYDSNMYNRDGKISRKVVADFLDTLSPFSRLRNRINSFLEAVERNNK